jgi:hypothetical protein
MARIIFDQATNRGLKLYADGCTKGQNRPAVSFSSLMVSTMASSVMSGDVLKLAVHLATVAEL